MSNQNEVKDNRRKERVCLDCNILMGGCGRDKRRPSFNISYMLNNDLWKKIINNEDGSSKGLLCIICAQRRADLQLQLGRKFKPSDFTSCPLNLRNRGMLWMLFPDALQKHMDSFVADEAPDEEE